MIKIGDTAEVIKITGSSPYLTLYKKGDSGIIKKDFKNGNIEAIIGSDTLDGSGWFVPKGSYSKTGRLKVRSVK